MTVVGVVAASAGGVEVLRERLVEPLIDDGYQVAVTLTPTAAMWLDPLGEIQRLTDLTRLPVRSSPRLPGEDRAHPKVDIYVAAPLTANTTAKLALGIADNQALTVLCENVATTPMIIFPRVNAAHARQPAWPGHIAALRTAGVELIYGSDVWPLAEPRSAGPRDLPWLAIMNALKSHLANQSQPANGHFLRRE